MTKTAAENIVAGRLALHTWEANRQAKVIPTLESNAADIAQTNADAARALGFHQKYLSALALLMHSE